MTWIKNSIEQRRQAGLFRQRRCLQSSQGAHIEVDGQAMLSFCSNDYLGLAADPRLSRTLAEAANEVGTGAGASHLVTGHHQVHHDLETLLAEFVGAERALLFSTGYMANLAVATTILGRHDAVFEDKLNHASLIDAARLSRARSHRYAHCDYQALARLLQTSTARRRLVLTDGVFSMDGDQADLSALLPLVEAHSAYLLLDDAHGLGVTGEGGRGSYAQADVVPGGRLILMGTLGKALGTFGAFVAGDSDFIELLIQQARTYIYTTALPPAIASATRTAVEIIQAEPWRRSHLFDMVQRFRLGARDIGLNLMPSRTPIQPLIVGEAGHAVAVSDALQAMGIMVPAIRPPTVAEGSARLRFTFSSLHKAEDVDRLLLALDRIKAKLV